jgi:hypothetical protein
LRQAVAAMKKDSLLVQTATARASAHYMPPFFTVFSLPADQDRAVLRAGVIVYEEAANQGLVPAEVAILWELDCENGRQRVLESISFATHGEAPNVDTVPSSWSYFAPHSMGEDMQTLLCDKKLTAPDNTPATQKPTS